MASSARAATSRAHSSAAPEVLHRRLRPAQNPSNPCATSQSGAPGTRLPDPMQTFDVQVRVMESRRKRSDRKPPPKENTMRPTLTLVAALALALAVAAHADDEITLDVVDLHGEADDVVNLLVLPESAAEQAHTSASFGLETANDARVLRREFGERMAEDARGGNVGAQVRDSIGDTRPQRPDPGRP
jgi:hypothetical protein